MSLSEERDATCQMLLYSQHQAAAHMVSDIFHRWQDFQTLGDPGQMLSSLPQQQVEAMLERPCSPEIPCEGRGGFGAEPGQVQQGSGEGSREGLGGFGAKPGQVQQGSEEGFGEGFGEGRGGFGAEPGQVQKGSGEGSGEGRESFDAEPAQVQQEKVLEKVPGGFGAEPGQVQQGSEKVPEKVWVVLVQSQVRFKTGSRRRLQRRSRKKFWESLVEGQVRLTDSRGFPALGFAARFGKICKNKTLRLLGIPQKFFFKKNFC